MRRLTAALLLAACAPVAPVPPAQGLFPDAAGLQPAGTALRIDFGRAEAGTVAAVSRLLGSGPVSSESIDDCGAGPVTASAWPNGLTLNFRNGTFAGWVLVAAPGAPATADGITPGLPQSALGEVRYTTTSLGLEFARGGIFGLIEDGRVALLWSGVTCFFR